MAGEIQIGGTTFATESGGTVTVSNVDSATNRTNLGLGSMATQNANAVALTGGSLTGTEIDLKSSGTTIYKSDGTTAVLSESGSVVTLTSDKVVATQGLGGTPAFSAYMGSDQTVSHGTTTKLNFDTEEFDTNNNFDTSTYRFTPTVAGYYQIIVSSTLSSTTSTNRITVNLYKNAGQYKTGSTSAAGAATYPSSIVSTILYMNGSTDYVEGYVYIDIGSGTGTIFADFSTRSQFSGVLVRAA
jgi:hypothetical protein